MYLVTIVVITAYFTGYGYIEPFFQQVAGLPDDAITFALVLFGAAGLVGSLLFARLGHVTLATFIRFACAGIAAALLLMAFAATGGEVSSCLVCVLWGACGVAVQRVVQRRCHQMRARRCEAR